MELSISTKIWPYHGKRRENRQLEFYHHLHPLIARFKQRCHTERFVSCDYILQFKGNIIIYCCYDNLTTSREPPTADFRDVRYEECM